MIDMHCHLLYSVDDGAKNLEESVLMLQRARRQGITHIILTPHYRRGMFAYPRKEIDQNFRTLRPYAQELGIKLYLGCEYHVDGDIIRNLNTGRCLTLAGSRYVLAEYSHITEYSYIIRMTQTLIFNGYRPIIAHAERYPAITVKWQRAQELRRMGALIQVNADAVLGYDGRPAKKFCRRLFRAGAADLAAGDSHGVNRRPCRLAECREYITRKYGEETAKKVFLTNPARILRDGRKPA